MMAESKPYARAKQTAIAFIKEAREAGWRSAKLSIHPDGIVTVDASMVDPEGADDFLSPDLRMGK